MTMPDALRPLPLSRPYELSDLGAAGADVRIEADAAERRAMAQWLEILEVRAFRAEIRLQRRASDTFLYEAELEAELVHACVVTLAPVGRHYTHQVRRVLEVRPRRRQEPDEKGGVLTLAAGDDDAPEQLESYRYDLVVPLLEELSLGLDPYPRAEGVEFELPSELVEERESPFAALARLKRPD